MPKAIETQIAPAIKAYTNIPGKVGTQSQGGGSYQFHELGPQGQTIDNPEQFASIQAATPPDTGPSYLEYAEKLKVEIGDPFVINVDGEARKLLDAQEPDIFREWSGGQFQLGGYMPPKVKKAWGEYKQRLLGNALKIVNDQKKNKIAEYNQRLAQFKTDQDLKREAHAEKRLSESTPKETGVLTENQAAQMALDLFPDYATELKAQAVEKFTQFMTREENNAEGRRNALLNTMNWARKRKEAKNLGDEGLMTDPTKKTEDQKKEDRRPWVGANPPKGYKFTGRYSNGEPVYRYQ